MSDQIERALRSLERQLTGRVSRPGNDGYAAATAIWAKPVGRMPRAVVHCRTTEDVQLSIGIARDCGLPLSVRGGGHDWAGRALCPGVVIGLSRMSGVVLDVDRSSAIISGSARATDVARVTDPLGLAAVTGSVGAVGMAGLTLGGGYGPLIGRFGLALDNLLAAEVVLAMGASLSPTMPMKRSCFGHCAAAAEISASLRPCATVCTSCPASAQACWSIRSAKQEPSSNAAPTSRPGHPGN